MPALVSISLPSQILPKRLIRVFPRRTKATPNDAMAYFGPPDLFAEADEMEQWKHVADQHVSPEAVRPSRKPGLWGRPAIIHGEVR